MNETSCDINSNYLKGEACSIINILIGHHTVHKTFFCTNISNGIKSKDYTIKDLGDYVPFFLYFGYKDFCRQHLSDIVSYTSSGILPPQSKLLRIPVSSTYDHSDFILGLLDYLEVENDPEIEACMHKVVDKVNAVYFNSSLPSSFYCSLFNRAIPLFDTKDGMFIELFVDLYKKYGDETFLSYAEQLFNTMISIPSYRELGLWPSLICHDTWVGRCMGKIGNVRRQTSTVRLMKNNTNTLYGFLSLFQQTHSEEIKAHILNWVETVMDTMVNDTGMAYNFAVMDGGSLSPYEANLTIAFTLIDLFCDCAFFLKETRCLQYAEKIAGFWMGQQGKTGLFPLHPQKKESYLDSETDMIVALWKLGELSGNRAYFDSSIQAFQGLLNHHKGDRGYYLQVDIESGECTNPMYKTKFIALMLKAFILFSENTQIYQNTFLFNLLRDR